MTRGLKERKKQEPDKIKYLKELKSVKEFSIKKNDKIEIEEEKQGEDKQVKRKPRNLLDFLRNG